MQNLYRYRILHLHVCGPINGAHPAFAHFFVEPVLIVEKQAHKLVGCAPFPQRRTIERAEHKLILQLAFAVRALFHLRRPNRAETGSKSGMIVQWAHGTVKQLIVAILSMCALSPVRRFGYNPGGD
jgi:hypothetical protein